MSKTHIRILFSSAGRRVALIRCFRQAATALNIDLSVLATDCRPEWSPACIEADHCFTVSKITDPSFMTTTQDLARTEQVDLIIPCSDLELIPYAQVQTQFAELGTHIVLSSEESIHIFRDKWKTYEAFKTHNIPTPTTWQYTPALEFDDLPYPCIAKPVDGSCSKGIFVMQHAADFQQPAFLQSATQSHYLIQPFVAGDEYTVNCYSAGDGALISATPHKRYFVRDGEVCFAETEKIDALNRIAEQLTAAFPGLKGPFCFQGKIAPDGDALIYELNPRFGGGYPIADQAGNTMARWLLEAAADLPTTHTDAWENHLRMLRYDDALFVSTP